VNAASAVSARTVTWRAPAVPRTCSMLSAYIAVLVRLFPKLPPLEQNGCGPSTLISPRLEREGIAAFDAVPLEGLAPHPSLPRKRGRVREGVHIAVVGIEYIDVLRPNPGTLVRSPGGAFVVRRFFKIKLATDRQVVHRSLRNRRYRA
jgi:hypothetical protein